MPVIAILMAVVLAVLAGIALFRAVRLRWTYRGARVISCPENHGPAGVSLDSRHVAAHPFSGAPPLRLSSCSRWPGRAGCGQDCLRQIAASPEDCLVRNILLQWYAGKSCVSCGRPFGDIARAGVKPAVLCADKVSVEWSEIPTERLSETLSTVAPICFACHMARKMLREHRELVSGLSESTGRPAR